MSSESGIEAAGVDNPNPCSMCGTTEGDRCTANQGITFCLPCWLDFHARSQAMRDLLREMRETQTESPRPTLLGRGLTPWLLLLATGLAISAVIRILL